MRYRLERIVPASALRVGCALGWLVMLCPALCLAGLAAQAIRRLDATLRQVEPIELAVLGQTIARIDFLEALQLDALAQTVGRLAGNLPLTIALLALLLVLVGAAALVGVALLFSLGYNLLARLGGGLEVELHPTRAPD